MSSAVKIGVIGAGSAQFSLGLVRDLILTEGLRGGTVCFMDVDAERLELVHRLATRYVHEIGVDLRFEQSMEREAALVDADFVINTALVGGHPAEEAERRLAEEHGYYRGIRPLHMQLQLGMILSVARDLERLCPDAWLIQSSNPVFEGCTLMSRETGVKVVGVCHGFYGYRSVCRVLGIDPDRVTWQAPGFNHVIYLTHFRYRGENAYPLLDQWIATKAVDYWATHRPTYGDNQMSRAAIDHYQRVGLMPLGDTPRAFTTWWYHTDLETKKRWFGHLGGFDSEVGWQQYLDKLRQNLQTLASAARDDHRPVSEALPLTHSGELQVPLIDSLTNDIERTIQVNVPNRGAIQGIPDDVVVEGQAVVSGKGIQLLQVGRLPETLMLQILLPRWLLLERTLSAFMRRDYPLLRDIVLEDHRTRSPEQADALLDAMLALPHNAELTAWYGRPGHETVTTPTNGS
ncbi:MAG: alpha-glucosidase/alpha-galactosidase [Chloroflexota bacterium]